MIIHNSLDKLFDHRIKTGILRILCRENAGLTGRQLAKIFGASPTTVNKFLKSLTEEGIIKATAVGNAYLYNLNRDNYVAMNLVKPFFEKERGVLSAMARIIKKAIAGSRAPAETVAIFGSVARKKEGPKSDIDLIVVLRDIKDKEKIEDSLAAIAVIMARNFGTAIVPYILSVAQFKRKAADDEPVIKDILGAYILVHGRPLERLVI